MLSLGVVLGWPYQSCFFAIERLKTIPGGRCFDDPVPTKHFSLFRIYWNYCRMYVLKVLQENLCSRRHWLIFAVMAGIGQVVFACSRRAFIHLEEISALQSGNFARSSAMNTDANNAVSSLCSDKPREIPLTEVTS